MLLEAAVALFQHDESPKLHAFILDLLPERLHQKAGLSQKNNEKVILYKWLLIDKVVRDGQLYIFVMHRT